MSAISPRDLLAQARDLATRDPLKPKQASLRRAVSTAYYALFHLLVTAASQSLGRGSAPLSRLLARAFDHSEMEKACGTFAAGGAMPQAVTGAYGPIVVPPELRRVAQAFRDLQEARHDADYGTLRHALACTMLRRGASLIEIGQILRHRNPDTTALYAKVDIAALRALAPAWPRPAGDA